MVAQGHWLLLFAGTAAFALVVLSSPRLTVDLEVCLFLIAIAPAALAAQPLVTYVIEHPWLVSEAWRGAFGLRATPAVAIVAVGLGLRLHMRPESCDPLSAIPARNP